MEYPQETSLPRPYTPAPDPDKDASRPGLQLRNGRKVPRPVLWLAIAICITFLLGGFYSLYTSLTDTLTGTSTTSSSSSSSVPTPTASELSHSYGIAAGGSLGDLNDAQLDQRMADIAATGAKWIRFDFNWSLIQPDNSTDYKWDSYDRLVSAAQKHGLFVLGILDSTPAWARADACSGSDKCYPANDQDFANFAKAVSDRYKNKGLHYWEIWNEPNSPQFWQPKADPAGYARLLQATASALRSADKDVYIITAGLSPQETNDTSFAPIDFLTAVYKAGAKDSFDAVADHPYTFPLSPKSTVFQAWNQMASSGNSLRQIMLANGDGNKKIWITEYGAPTGGPGPNSTIDNPNLDAHPYKVDEQLQAKLLSDAVGLYKSYNWVGPFMYYSYQDAGTSQDTNENFFGLVRADGSKKPAYQAFHDAATK